MDPRRTGRTETSNRLLAWFKSSLKILLILVVIKRADVQDNAVVLIMLILTSSAEVCYDVDLAFVIHLADLRGLAPHLLHVTPNVCIIFAVYESVMSL